MISFGVQIEIWPTTNRFKTGEQFGFKIVQNHKASHKKVIYMTENRPQTLKSWI